MTRLTIAIKDKIVTNALKQAGVFEAEIELRNRRAKLAEDVRVEWLGGPEVVSKIEKTILKIKKLQSDLCFNKISRSTFSISSDYEMYGCNLGGSRVHLQFNGLISRDDRSIPIVEKKIAPNHPTLPGDHPLVEEFHNIETASRELKERRENISVQVKGSLSPFTTIKKLLAAWPEAKDLLPETVSESKPQLPVVQVKDLNKLIGLPKGDNDE